MTKHLFLALLAMFLLTLSVAAQNSEERDAAREDLEAAVNKLIINRFMSHAFENDPSGLFLGIMATEKNEPFLAAVREEFGITDEQKTHFEMIVESMNESKEAREIEENINNKIKSGDFDLTETDREGIDFVINLTYDQANEATAAAFSPEQIQKMDGMILALSGGLESPFFNDRHMTALEMTEEQKKQFAAIDEETKESREKMIAGLTETIFSLEKSGELKFQDLFTALGKFKEFSKELKKRRQAVLTASQISKMKTLSRLPKSLSVYNLLPKWMPNADSWKPGDLVPEGLVPENKPTRPFPREEKE